MSELILTDQTFQQEVIQSDKPVLVDFWATWCGPCQVQAPVLGEVAKEFEGKAKVAKLEVDENPQTPVQYNIMSIPTLIIFKGGKAVAQMIGLQPKPRLVKALNQALKN